MHLGNSADKNIQLMAEGLIELSGKLNQAIPMAGRNLAYEVEMDYLVWKVHMLGKEIAELKAG